MTKKLGDIAHARAGDKGDVSILMLAPYDPADYALVVSAVTPDRLAAHFGTTPAKIAVRPSADLHAVTIVLRDQLLGGVTRATTLDPHGKSLSGHLLQLDLDTAETGS
jgi:hypothetical protein